MKKWSESESRSVLSDSLWPHVLYSPWNSPGQNTRVGRLSLLQGIFPTQGSNPGLPHCRRILYQLSHKGNPRILEWVACPFSSRSFWPRSQTGVSCIAGGFFAYWAIMEAPESQRILWFKWLARRNRTLKQKTLKTPTSSMTPFWQIIYFTVVYICIISDTERVGS